MATTAPTGVREEMGTGTHPSHAAPMTHRQILEALSGLLLGMFVAILSSTIVSTALPRIITDLHGSQSSYTWVVTASLLAVTASTPIWGKLADLFSKKTLVQLSLTIFVLASVVAGLSQNTSMLIACRVFQGIGVGGLSALSQIIMAAMISPRERGRYSGYLGANFAVATVGGPLIGGVITDTDWLGWRWCFYVGVPFAVVALIVLQKTLKLPVVKRDVKVDWAGAFFVSAAVSLLLVWVTLAGDKYDWISWQTYAMVGGSVVLGAIFLLVEAKADEPIIPLRLFRNRTITLTSFASLFVGVAMFGATVFLSQYFQLARDKTPTMSGIMTIPMIGGLFLSSMISGLIITRTGRWKAWLVSGAVFLVAGLGLLGSVRYDIEYWHMAIYMAVLGMGIGMMMQNLVLATQNQVDVKNLGAASSVVNFFRSLGGAVGVSALGALLSNRITHYVEDGFRALGPKAAAATGGPSGGSRKLPDLDLLPRPIRTVIEAAYGHGIGDVFLYAVPAAVVALLMVLLIKEVPLKTHSALHQETTTALPATDTVAQMAGATGSMAAPGTGEDGEARPALAEPDERRRLATASAESGHKNASLGSSITGYVRNADGSPLPHAAVTLISLEGRQLGRSVAHADGAYALDTPGQGSYMLIASADGHQPQASTVVVGDQPLAYDLLLTGTSALTGTVRSAADGSPVADATVVVTDVRGEVLVGGKTGNGGEFVFDELVAGTFALAVNAAGFRPLALPVVLGAQGTTRIEVELRSGARVRGTVRAGADRLPLPDARVTLVDAAGNVVASATTAGDGTYAFTNLEEGDYTLIASGYPPVTQSLPVTDHGVEGCDVELAHPDE